MPRNFDYQKAASQERARVMRAAPELRGFKRITVPQRSLIRRLEREHGLEPADLTGLSSAEASELITRLTHNQETP